MPYSSFANSLRLRDEPGELHDVDDEIPDIEREVLHASLKHLEFSAKSMKMIADQKNYQVSATDK